MSTTTTDHRDIARRLYPEVAAGGYSRVDGTVELYQRVRAVCPADAVVVDLGAGRGQAAEDPVPVRRQLQDLRDVAGELIGLDVDPVVRENPQLTRAEVITEGQPLPLDDASVDVVVSDFTFEHITDPAWCGRELTRIVRCGGWICARTPNRWGYIGIPTRLVPNRLHDAVLRRVQPQKQARDTFPTAYLLNSRRDLEEHFPVSAFEHLSYVHDSEPAYFGASETAWRLARGAFRLVPERFGSMWFVFLRKR